MVFSFFIHMVFETLIGFITLIFTIAFFSINLLPHLGERKSPIASFIIAFLFTYIAVCIYFKSYIDFFNCSLILLFISIVIIVTTSGTGIIILIPILMFVQGFYGYFRALKSNENYNKEKKESSEM